MEKARARTSATASSWRSHGLVVRLVATMEDKPSPQPSPRGEGVDMFPLSVREGLRAMIDWREIEQMVSGGCDAAGHAQLDRRAGGGRRAASYPKAGRSSDPDGRAALPVAGARALVRGRGGPPGLARAGSGPGQPAPRRGRVRYAAPGIDPASRRASRLPRAAQNGLERPGEGGCADRF